ncbi:MAG: peptide chain release factor N(5)-glutamine methyltransferase [Holosporales bacterium]|jgi:release factor glutamine methyltransferase|nr:peptide chain release factor N(5)-glutamine methyltransferase [Holosporales bacterium]
MHLSTALKLAKDIMSRFEASDEAESFAKHVLAYLTGIEVKCLFLHNDQALSDDEVQRYLAYVRRGLCGEPASKICHKRWFWNHEFYVNEDVLDPRPDSEVVIEAVREHISDPSAAIRILDLGTGSGCLLITLLHEFRNAYGIGVDLSEKALKVAVRNAKSLKVCGRADFICGCWGQALYGGFDVIVANPPYIPSEEILDLSDNVKNFDPRLALDGGKDGLACYREIAKVLGKLLRPDVGAAFFEVGAGQTPDVSRIFEAQGYRVKKVFKDLNGLDRCLKVQI